jgi:PGAP2IP, first transmembrane domain
MPPRARSPASRAAAAASSSDSPSSSGSSSFKPTKFSKMYAAGLLCDTISAFACWAMMIQLPNMTFFYPCVMMGFTGWEAVSLLYYIPYVLAFPVFGFSYLGLTPRWFRENCGAGGKMHGILHMLSVIGLAHFHLHEDPYFVEKFVLSAVGVCFTFLAHFSLWATAGDSRRDRSVIGFIFGLVLYLISTMYAFSMPPGNILPSFSPPLFSLPFCPRFGPFFFFFF